MFQEQSAILVSKLSQEVGNEDGFNLFKYITLCTLDIICGEFHFIRTLLLIEIELNFWKCIVI